MNDQERPAQVVVDSWEEEDPLAAFSDEAEASTDDTALSAITAADTGHARRRSFAPVVGVLALGVLAGSVTALLNSAVAPVADPIVPPPVAANQPASLAPPEVQVGSAGEAPRAEVAIESVEPPRTARNSRAFENSTAPAARSKNPPRVVASRTDVVQTPPVTSTRERRAPGREARDVPPSRLPDVPVGTLAFGAPAPIAIVPPPTAIAPPPIAEARTPPVATAAPAPPVRGAERAAVTTVLQRYAAAFGSLDVGEVKAVWPAVNEGALARAFSTLQDQRFDLGECDINVTGASAVATCAGRASYTPRVGSRKPRSERRQWTFYLRQDGPQWSIGTVRTR